MDILCGLDFTEAGGQACQISAQLALRLGDRLILAHAAEAVAPPAPGDSAAEARIQQDRAAIVAELEQRATSLRTTGIDVTAHLLVDGPPEQSLIELADGLAPRLVVVGTGYSATNDRPFVGSIAETIARQAHYPVLIVGTQPSNLAQWAMDERPLRVLLALDDSPASTMAVAWVHDLRTRLPVDLQVVHFYYQPQAPASQDVELPHSDKTRLLQELQERIGPLPGSGSLHLHLYGNWVRVPERLAVHLESTPADVVILGAHTRSVFEARHGHPVLVNMLHTTHSPLMCVPSAAPPPPAERRLPAMQTVLAACDLAPGSHHAAVYYAYALLRGRGGKVHLCHVVADAAAVPSATAALEALIPAQESMHGVTTEVHVRVHGAAGEALAQLADELAADVLCLGTHGRSAFSQVFTGSTANQVSRHTSKPVLLARDDLPF